MKKPRDLSRAELERIADAVQRCLYFDENTGLFDPGHDWSGADVCEALACALSYLGMVPDEKIEEDEGPALTQPTAPDRTVARKIQLPCYGITVTLARKNGVEEAGSGSIVSNLREPETAANRQYNAAIDGLEALILAHARAGVDVESPAYLEGIETAVDAIANRATP
jgi:hypothetical protein